MYCEFLAMSFSPGITFAVDDVVMYKFGEKSSRALSSTGFQDVTFKSYARYLIIFTLVTYYI